MNRLETPVAWSVTARGPLIVASTVTFQPYASFAVEFAICPFASRIPFSSQVCARPPLVPCVADVDGVYHQNDLPTLRFRHPRCGSLAA